TTTSRSRALLRRRPARVKRQRRRRRRRPARRQVINDDEDHRAPRCAPRALGSLALWGVVWRADADAADGQQLVEGAKVWVLDGTKYYAARILVIVADGSSGEERQCKVHYLGWNS